MYFSVMNLDEKLISELLHQERTVSVVICTLCYESMSNAVQKVCAYGTVTPVLHGGELRDWSRSIGLRDLKVRVKFHGDWCFPG